MTALLLLLAASTVNGNSRTEELTRCLEQKDKACISALLVRPPSDGSPEYWAAAARGELFLGKRQDAVQAANRAVELKPGDFDLLMEQGWIDQKAGDQLSAVRSFLLAGRVKPRTPAVFYELGMSFFLLHQFERAATHFNSVLELDPRFDRAEFMTGILDVLRNGESEAKAHFERALALQPNNPHYLLHFGVLLVKLNEPDKARSLMVRAEELDPSNPLTHFNLGILYRQTGMLTEAERELRTAVQLRPGLTHGYYQLATVYRLQGRKSDEASALREFTKLKADDSDDDPIDANLTR